MQLLNSVLVVIINRVQIAIRISKVLFSETKSVFSTLLFQYSTQSWCTTEEHGHFAFLVFIQLLEYLIIEIYDVIILIVLL